MSGVGQGSQSRAVRRAVQGGVLRGDRIPAYFPIRLLAAAALATCRHTRNPPAEGAMPHAPKQLLVAPSLPGPHQCRVPGGSCSPPCYPGRTPPARCGGRLPPLGTHPPRYLPPQVPTPLGPYPPRYLPSEGASDAVRAPCGRRASSWQGRDDPRTRRTVRSSHS